MGGGVAATRAMRCQPGAAQVLARLCQAQGRVVAQVVPLGHKQNFCSSMKGQQLVGLQRNPWLAFLATSGAEARKNPQAR